MNSSRRWSFQYKSKRDEYSRSAQAFELPAEPVAQSFGLSSRPSPPLDLLAPKVEATLREPFAQPDWHYLLFVHNNDTEMTTGSEQEESISPLSSSSDFSSPTRIDSYFPEVVPRQPSKKPRYYSHALSWEDKKALHEGHKNHNLKEWDAGNLLQHHASRKELLPRFMEKLEKIKTLSDVKQHKNQSEREITQAADKVCYFSKRARKNKGADTKKVRESTYTQPKGLSQSMYDLRLSDASVSDRTTLPPTPSLDHPLHRANRAHIRAASSGPTLSGPAPLRRSQAPSGHTSGSSSRVRSPLANEVPQFIHNPEVTFDSFLAPHKTGKGETHWESENVKQPKALKSPGSSSENGGVTASKRLSKMPSLPNLRKRFTRVGSGASE